MGNAMAISTRLALLLLGPTLVNASPTDRDWWRSEAGKVTEHRNAQDTTCTLVLKNDKGQFQFMWSDTLPPYAIVERPEWTLPLNRMLTVSLRIGNTWLKSPNGSANFPALTEPHGLMFLLSQPVEELLSGAQDLAFQAPDQTFEMPLPRPKVRQLMKALHRCNAQIKSVQKPS
jgi:hypothetical protein